MVSLKGLMPDKKSKNVIIGAAITTFIEPFIDNLLANFVPQQQIIGGVGIDDLAKIGIGSYLARKSGYQKGIGYSLLITGTQRVVSGLLAPAAITSAPAVSGGAVIASDNFS